MVGMANSCRLKEAWMLAVAFSLKVVIETSTSSLPSGLDCGTESTRDEWMDRVRRAGIASDSVVAACRRSHPS